MAALQDLRGCLTPAGLQAFRAAPPGRAPLELARHVAGCARCQERVLLADEGARGPGKRRAPPPLWRVFAVFLAGLLAAIGMYVWLRRILGQLP